MYIYVRGGVGELEERHGRYIKGDMRYVRDVCDVRLLYIFFLFYNRMYYSGHPYRMGPHNSITNTTPSYLGPIGLRSRGENTSRAATSRAGACETAQFYPLFYHVTLGRPLIVHAIRPHPIGAAMHMWTDLAKSEIHQIYANVEAEIVYFSLII